MVATAPVPTLAPGVPAEGPPDLFLDGLPVPGLYELAGARYTCPKAGCPNVDAISKQALATLGEAKVGCREQIDVASDREVFAFRLHYQGDDCDLEPLPG